MYPRLVFKLGTVDGFSVADNSDDGTIGTGRLMEVKVMIDQVLFYLSQLILARSLIITINIFRFLSCECAQDAAIRQ